MAFESLGVRETKEFEDAIGDPAILVINGGDPTTPEPHVMVDDDYEGSPPDPYLVTKKMKSVLVLVDPKHGAISAQRYLKAMRKKYPNTNINMVLEQSLLGKDPSGVSLLLQTYLKCGAKSVSVGGWMAWTLKGTKVIGVQCADQGVTMFQKEDGSVSTYGGLLDDVPLCHPTNIFYPRGFEP
mmetsp:Transcript_106778/g.185563  ORF Transcript_106778/g.185563 Transcript_106778/m.185563 type:complete len:183 (+) Transcript_106778:79-627(+)